MEILPSPLGGPQCHCEVYQRCVICDPSHFAHHKEGGAHREHQKEQEEAAILDTVRSVLEDRFNGFHFTSGQVVEADGTTTLTLKREGKANPCKVHIYMEF